ncbi:MAG: COX15/CtaA family protein [Halobacteriales archaeon]
MAETRTADALGSGEGGYRALLAGTAGLVFLTVLLGVSTRATGAGLACNANWPLCDGGVLNLFPATLPSAFEWLHRLIAGTAGVAIVAVAALAWRDRDGDRRVRRALTAAIVLLPVQVALGRETVRSFAPPVLALHYWTAMSIYGLVVGATALAWRDAFGRRSVGRALGLALALVPLQLVLAPPVIARYSAPVQAAHYAVLLVAFAALALAAILVRERGGDTLVRRGTALSVGLLPLVVFLGRQRIVHPLPAIELLHPLAAGALLLAVAVALVGERRARG